MELPVAERNLLNPLLTWLRAEQVYCSSTGQQHALQPHLNSNAISDPPSSRCRRASAIVGGNWRKRRGIPANFLAKLMLMLRNAGIVDATRGLGGGYRLVKQPDEITLMQVVELFEGIRARPGCFLGEKHACNDQEACTAHSGWKVVCEAYRVHDDDHDSGHRLKQRRSRSRLQSLTV